MKNTLAVRTESQKVLFDSELKGQISDGAWENSGPRDHWRDWARAEVVVDPVNPGRDFPAVKDNYNFVRRDLVEAVGDRMIAAVREKCGLEYGMRELRSDLIQLGSIIRIRRV